MFVEKVFAQNKLYGPDDSGIEETLFAPLTSSDETIDPEVIPQGNVLIEQLNKAPWPHAPGLEDALDIILNVAEAAQLYPGVLMVADAVCIWRLVELARVISDDDLAKISTRTASTVVEL